MKASILIPAYNASDYLQELLQELYIQTMDYPQTEVIVVDDGSEEDMTWLDDLDWIKVIHQENRGEAGARNRLLDEATGDYIAFIDCDDMIAPYYLKEIYRNAESGADLVIYQWEFEDGRIGDQHDEPLINWNVWSWTFKRSIITERFDEKRNYAADYYWLEKQIKPELSRIKVDIPIIIYNTERPDSQTNRFQRGEIGLWRN